MFADASVVGCSWEVLAARLDADGVVARWASHEPELADLRCVADLLAAWADSVRTHPVGDALIRLAAVDGGDDQDAALVVLHLASPVVWRLVGQLGDLDPHVLPLVVAELCCQIRGYRWRTRYGALLTSLEWDTRAGVLAELRPSDRRHPERVERLTWDGDVEWLMDSEPPPDAEEDVDLIGLLSWAMRDGLAGSDIELLLACQGARGRRETAAVAAANHMSVRTLYRRRVRTVRRLRRAATAYLAATA